MAILSGFLNCSLLLKGKRGPAQTCHCRRACRYITFTYPSVFYCFDFPGDSVVKNLPADAGDVGSIPGSERSPREEMATHSSILAKEIPWTVEPGGLQSWGCRVRHD